MFHMHDYISRDRVSKVMSIIFGKYGIWITSLPLSAKITDFLKNIIY